MRSIPVSVRPSQSVLWHCREILSFIVSVEIRDQSRALAIFQSSFIVVSGRGTTNRPPESLVTSATRTESILARDDRYHPRNFSAPCDNHFHMHVRSNPSFPPPLPPSPGRRVIRQKEWKSSEEQTVGLDQCVQTLWMESTEEFP